MKKYLVLLLLFTGLHYGSVAQDIHFTGKPLCERKVLGLSLTYDMVVKGHAGTIGVDSKEGAYTIFKITLPVN